MDVVGANVGTDDRNFFVRARRQGSGQGRTYSLTYRALDATGNVTHRTITVLVPHDRVFPVSMHSFPANRLLVGGSEDTWGKPSAAEGQPTRFYGPGPGGEGRPSPSRAMLAA